MGDGANRNKPCDCGSGKKFKKCCEERKPVSPIAMAEWGEPTLINGLRVSPRGHL